MLRFVACLGIGGVWPNAVALVAEAWPNASRPFLAGLLGAAANVGFVLLGVIGYCFPITGERGAGCSWSARRPRCRVLDPRCRGGIAAMARESVAGGERRSRRSPLREVLRRRCCRGRSWA